MKEKIKKIIVLSMMIIAIVNILCIIKVFFNDLATEIYIVPCIIVIILQIVAICILLGVLRKYENKKQEKYLFISILFIFVITFFIPVKVKSNFPRNEKRNIYS